MNGRLYDSFLDTARALNLVENDEQWRNALREAAQDQMPSEMRYFFALICLHNAPQQPSPLELWNEFQNQLSEDFIYHGDNHYTATNKALQV